MSRLFSIPILAYIASVIILNIGFSYVPMIETPIGLLSPMAVLAGLVFVLRDFAQRHAGHLVLVAMAVATILSFVLADPYVASASAAAFLTAELADYALYTWTKKPFHQRVLWSSVVSTPVDTLVFLLGISAFTTGTFALMVAAKMVAAVVIWIYYSGKENRVDLDEDSDFDHSASSPFHGDMFRTPLDSSRKDSLGEPVRRPY